MHLPKLTAIALATLAATWAGGPALAQPQSSGNEIKALKGTVEGLKKQLQDLRSQQTSSASNALDQARIEELRKQVLELRDLLQKQQTAQLPASLAAPVAEGQAEEAQEAVDARTPASKADIQGLRTDLENYKYDQSRLQERNIPSVVRNTKIGGSLTLGYATANPAVQPTSSAGTTLSAEERKNGFTPAVVGLNFSGNLYRDYEEGKNLTYRIAFQTSTNLGGSNAAYNSTGQSNTEGTQFNVTDAYLSYSFLPQSGNAEDPLGTLTFGQQVIPFGQDAQAIDPEVKAVIGNAGFVSGLGLGKRQIGLILKGDYDPYVDFTNNYRAPLLSYALGFVNGNGANKQDNNSMRDWIGRLVYTLPVDYASWFRQLQIGTSYYRGYSALGSSVSSATSNTTYYATKGLFTRTGFDLNWTHLPYSISYEWAYGKDQLYKNATNLTTNPDLYKRGKGQYINFGYTWGEQFLNSSKQQGKFDDYWPKSYQAFVRFDTWDPNISEVTARTSNSDRKQYITTLGLNVFFAETTKFQINYLHTRYQLEGATPTLLNPGSSNGIQAQFNATF
ncbi:porin [Aquabacterium sp.]|uniref:porin n=1 Tax=Aquabacterium sp. TaxID=1872578 RepID=UPI0035B1A29A